MNKKAVRAKISASVNHIPFDSLNNRKTCCNFRITKIFLFTNKFQYPCQIIQKGGRHANIPALFQPRVPGETDTDMTSWQVSTVQQVGAALGVAVVGILFTSVLTEATSLSQRGQYASAFVAGMFYNLAAAVLVCWLLWMMQKSPRISR
ncbi:TPA: hypothetical protein NPP67_000760 [Klebsiella variicola subsp. variicola]|nr:hypothetical protein [Klebsiella variicola subsp. variicola]HCI5976533.1 hypothetical protein [Klebsiella variicola subsp. variicola]HCI6097021.1 hypothetical protein [Klebsiella variicola subsp. variicola]HCI6739769.1 hypothetical protein [Klebsiella variicola subsp. variicola]